MGNKRTALEIMSNKNIRAGIWATSIMSLVIGLIFGIFYLIQHNQELLLNILAVILIALLAFCALSLLYMIWKAIYKEFGGY